MTAAEFRNKALDAIEQATQSTELPVVRIKKSAEVGTVVLPPDAKRRVVVRVGGIGKIVNIGGIDALTRGKTVIVRGNRVVITEVFKIEDGTIWVETTSKDGKGEFAASEIEGVTR